MANRSASSRSGAADLLEALGVKIELEPEVAASVLAEAGIVFLFAQTHPSSGDETCRSGARKQIGRRTTSLTCWVPLASPARVTPAAWRACFPPNV